MNPFKYFFKVFLNLAMSFFGNLINNSNRQFHGKLWTFTDKRDKRMHVCVPPLYAHMHRCEYMQVI